MNALLRTWITPALLAAGLLTGCNDDEKPKPDAGAADAGPAQPVLGGKLGAAVAAAESANAAPPSAADGGPPESGIFPAGGADAALAAGAPPKIELLGEGSEPRIPLVMAPAPEQRAVITAVLRLNQQPMVSPFDFNLALKVGKPKDKDDKAKDDKPKDDKAKDKDDKAKPDSGGLQVVAKVTSVTAGGQVLPKEISDALEKVKGSEIRYRLGPDGSMADLTVNPNKDLEPGLEVSLRAVSEAMAILQVPVPSKPVGVGGYWIVTDRATPFGIDVVRYRVFHVQKIDKDKATLSMELRQYAVKDELDLGSLAKGQKVKADRFESQGKGTVEWDGARLFAPGDEAGSVVGAQIGGAPPQGGRPGQAKGFQIEIGARTRDPGKDEKKK